MGRHTWLFTGSHEAAKNLTFMYSLEESCRMNGLDFGDYIEYVLERMQDGEKDARSLLPNCIVIPQTGSRRVILTSPAGKIAWNQIFHSAGIQLAEKQHHGKIIVYEWPRLLWQECHREEGVLEEQSARKECQDIFPIFLPEEKITVKTDDCKWPWNPEGDNVSFRIPWPFIVLILLTGILRSLWQTEWKDPFYI